MDEEQVSQATEDESRVFSHTPGMKGPRSVWRVASRPVELKRLITLVVIIALAALIVLKIDVVMAIVAKLWGIAVPLILGACLAYLLNLVMVRWESVWFPRSTKKLVVRSRRIVCILLSLATVSLVVAVAILLVSSEITEAFSALGKGLSAAFAYIGSMLSEYGIFLSDSPLAQIVPKDADAWQKLITEAASFLGGSGGVLSSVLGVSGHVAGAVVDAVVALVFAVYLLSGKERAVRGARRFGQWVLPERRYQQVEHACVAANRCFSRFIVGQCTEAIILGCLVALGMSVFGFPYAASVAFCVGITSLVPLVGAWIGGILGAVMIASVSLSQALWFAIFLVILQQIEGHAIYPHVVGAAVGISGIWVLVAVFVGGSLLGIPGVLLGVPAVATVKELLAEAKVCEGDNPSDDPPTDGESASQPA